MRELFHPRSHGQTGRFQVARWAAVRALWSDPDVVQVDIAAAASTSQTAVSQAVADLAARSPEELERLYLDAYPGPKGDITYWRSDVDRGQGASPNEARRSDPGDAAADVLAPWRTPSELIAYRARPLPESDMLEAGFIAVDEARDANVVLIAQPADKALLRQTAALDDVVVAHPLHVAYDLRRLGGEDRVAAASLLLGNIRTPAGATKPR